MIVKALKHGRRYHHIMNVASVEELESNVISDDSMVPIDIVNPAPITDDVPSRVFVIKTTGDTFIMLRTDYPAYLMNEEGKTVERL